MSEQLRTEKHTNPDGTLVEFTIEDYIDDHSGQGPSSVFIAPGSCIGKNLKVAGDVTILGDVGDDVTLVDCSIGEYVVIGNKVRIAGERNQKLHIGKGAVIRNDCTVMGNVGAGASIGHGCTVDAVPDKAIIGNNSRVQLKLDKEELARFPGEFYVGEKSVIIQVLPHTQDERGLRSLNVGANVTAVIRELVGEVTIQSDSALGLYDSMSHTGPRERASGLFNVNVPKGAFLPFRHVMTSSSVLMILTVKDGPVTILVREDGQAFQFSRDIASIPEAVLEGYGTVHQTLSTRHEEQVKTLNGRLSAAINRAIVAEERCKALA